MATVIRRPYPPSIATQLRQQEEAEKNKRMATALHDMPAAFTSEEVRKPKQARPAVKAKFAKAARMVEASMAKQEAAKKKPAAKKVKR